MRPPCTSHTFVSSANSVIKTPNYRFDHRRAIGTAARESKPGLTDSPVSLRKVATVAKSCETELSAKMAHPIGDGRFSVCIAQQKASPWKREKKICVQKKQGIAGKHFWVGIRHLQGIERGVPRTARQSGGLQQTKHYGDKKATCKKSYQSMRRQRFNMESLRHKTVCDKGKRGKEGISAWHIIQTPFPRRKHFRLYRRIA